MAKRTHANHAIEQNYLKNVPVYTSLVSAQSQLTSAEHNHFSFIKDLSLEELQHTK